MKWSHGSGDELHSYSFYFVMRTSCTLNSNFYFVFQQARAEQEEEYISNTLLKKIQALKKEKETLAMNYEQEEEYLTNDLSRKLMQVSEALTGEVGQLVQGRRNSIALAMELRLACINLPIYTQTPQKLLSFHQTVDRYGLLWGFMQCAKLPLGLLNFLLTWVFLNPASPVWYKTKFGSQNFGYQLW